MTIPAPHLRRLITQLSALYGSRALGTNLKITGYPEFGGNGVARWGDYSGAAIDTGGVAYMATEYTPDIARTMLANWCTYIIRLQP